MTVGANSYGTAPDVAAIVTVYTNAGVFDATTQPTLTSVESFIDQVSAIVNTTLADMGFTIPVTQADAKEAIKSIVIQYAVDLCHAARSSGRFFTERALNSGMSMMAQVRKEIRDICQESANGWQALGAARSTTGKSESMTAGVISLDFADHNETVY